MIIMINPGLILPHEGGRACVLTGVSNNVQCQCCRASQWSTDHYLARWTLNTRRSKRKTFYVDEGKGRGLWLHSLSIHKDKNVRLYTFIFLLAVIACKTNELWMLMYRSSTYLQYVGPHELVPWHSRESRKHFSSLVWKYAHDSRWIVIVGEFSQQIVCDIRK